MFRTRNGTQMDLIRLTGLNVVERLKRKAQLEMSVLVLLTNLLQTVLPGQVNMK